MSDVATREEFIGFFCHVYDDKKAKEIYSDLAGESNNEVNTMTGENIFSFIFYHLDDQYKTEDRNSEPLTFREYLLDLSNNLDISEDELKKRDLLRSPWPSVLTVIFLPIGGAFFTLACLLKQGRVDSKEPDEDFKGSLLYGFLNIIFTVLFVCSLIFGWAVWIQAIVGIIFALLELFSLLPTVVIIVNCYRDRKQYMPSDEYKALLPKVKNYLKQEKEKPEKKDEDKYEPKLEESKNKDKKKEEEEGEEDNYL